MDDKKNPLIVFRERLIGLQGCAKAVHDAGQTPEETASAAIRLFDLLEADAMRAAGLTRQSNPHDVPATARLRAEVEKFVQNNHLNRAEFEGWLGAGMPEVREGGLAAISDEHASRILSRQKGCLEAFAKARAATGQVEEPTVGQVDSPEAATA